jgi:hypothetical protein
MRRAAGCRGASPPPPCLWQRQGPDIAHHVIGCHLIQKRRVHNALDDVVCDSDGNICWALGRGCEGRTGAGRASRCCAGGGHGGGGGERAGDAPRGALRRAV